MNAVSVLSIQKVSHSLDVLHENALLSWFEDSYANTFRPKQNGRHFPDDIFKWIFLDENVWISIKI